jgi:hypothetical protein
MLTRKAFFPSCLSKYQAFNVHLLEYSQSYLTLLTIQDKSKIQKSSEVLLMFSPSNPHVTFSHTETGTTLPLKLRES